MAQLGNVPQIKAVQQRLDEMKVLGLLSAWELPYEKLLTRLTAARFFLTPAPGAEPQAIWQQLQAYGRLRYQPNPAQKMSALAWQVEFNEEPVR
jgi:hypothetical protein